jgi:hypothetical protein
VAEVIRFDSFAYTLTSQATSAAPLLDEAIVQTPPESRTYENHSSCFID